MACWCALCMCHMCGVCLWIDVNMWLLCGDCACVCENIVSMWLFGGECVVCGISVWYKYVIFEVCDVCVCLWHICAVHMVIV